MSKNNSDKPQKVKTHLRMKASENLQKEIEEELEKKDPEGGSAKAAIDDNTK